MTHTRQALLATVWLAALSVGCVQTWKSARFETPAEYEVLRGQLVVHSDFSLAVQHRVLEDLSARREDLSRLLGLPPGGEPIHVYLFQDADRFARYMQAFYPEFPQRRAFFVQTDTRLEVYAHWGDRVAEDLRHEVTHGYLHSQVPNLPLWLDEGLAEYFEVSRGRHGVNRDHVDNLVARLEHGAWHPNLERLERLDEPFGMTLDDYAESWAWVHFLLESDPRTRQFLVDYLAELRAMGTAGPMAQRLPMVIQQPERALIEHVRQLGAGGRGPGAGG